MKKILLFAITLSLLVAVCALSASAANIGSAADLIALINDTSKWDGEFTLTADVDISGKTLGQIGTYEKPFSGTFDGNGHTVTVSVLVGECGGLFGVIENATVKNLTVKGTVECTFAAENAETKLESGYSGTGAVVGVVHTGSTVENCTSYANVLGPCNVGGVIGLINNVGEATVTVTNCVNYGVADSTYGNLGGVIGRIRTETEAYPALTVKGCANYANLSYKSEDRARFAGIAAYIRSNKGFILIENCRNEGNLEGVNAATASGNFPHMGGILGRCEMIAQNSGMHVIGCYNSGMISSTKYAAGIVAYISRDDACIDYSTTIKDCVNVGALSGGTYAGGILAYSNNSCMADTRFEIVNCLNTAPVVAEGSAGGILGRQTGCDIKGTVNLGAASATSCGGLVGKADGQVFCEIANSFYSDVSAVATGLPTPFCMDSGSKSFSMASVTDSASFAGLDFADAWTVGKLCPVPKSMSAENIVIPTENAPVVIPPVETTAVPETTAAPAETGDVTGTVAPETTAVPETTAAPETEETKAPETEATKATEATTAKKPAPAPAEEGANVGLIIGIVVGVLVVAAVVVVIIIKKKKA